MSAGKVLILGDIELIDISTELSVNRKPSVNLRRSRPHPGAPPFLIEAPLRITHHYSRLMPRNFYIFSVGFAFVPVGTAVGKYLVIAREMFAKAHGRLFVKR